MDRLRMSVAIVDDDESVRRALQRLLHASDLIAETYASGQEFLDSLKSRRRPDCLVLDLQMPGMNGLEVQRELTNAGLRLPVVVITGHDEPGAGSHVGRAKDSRVPVATLNVSGRVFMNGAIDDPFRIAEREVERLRKEAAVIVVDMHAEATSEKMALGYFLAGKVSAVVGTHTHVPTCDHRILPGGTAYVSDLGMTGPYDSVIGVEAETIVKRFLTGLPSRYETAKSDPRLAAAVVTVDPGSGRATAIDRMLIGEGDVEAL